MFFNSNDLDRTVYLREVDDMSARDISCLKAELKVAVFTMQEKKREQKDTAETDWLHGITLKIKICEQFLDRINELSNIDSSKLNHYHLLYLRQEVSNELGPLKAQQLFDKSRVGAVAQLRKESAS